jgi:hypothetical protein
MRKALIGLVLAATVLTPIAAQAQDRGGRNRHEQREDNRGGGGGGEARQQRQEHRQQRQELRQQQRAQVQQQRVQQQPQVQVAQRERRGGNWGGNDGNRGDRGQWRGNDGNRGDRGQWRGNQGQNRPSTVQGWGGPNTPEYREHAERYNRRAQENALRYGTQEQRREVYRQRREDGNWRGDRDGNWRGDRDGNWRGDRDRNWRDGRRGNWSGNWNRGWRNDRRYDWNRWRYANRNIFRLPTYYAPYRNYRYSRLGIGFFLDSLFFDQRYWLGDPYQYRLPPAPPGTQWIRYYDDVLLVDVYSGEVIDVIYDFFW